MSTRRAWMWAVVAAGAGGPLIASAQGLKRVGVLFFGGPPGPESASIGFGQGMRELGYVDGRNVVIDYRYADGRPERLATLAATARALGLTLQRAFLLRADRVVE